MRLLVPVVLEDVQVSNGALKWALTCQTHDKREVIIAAFASNLDARNYLKFITTDTSFRDVQAKYNIREILTD